MAWVKRLLQRESAGIRSAASMVTCSLVPSFVNSWHGELQGPRQLSRKQHRHCASARIPAQNRFPQQVVLERLLLSGRFADIDEDTLSAASSENGLPSPCNCCLVLRVL